ncbi:MULTISPECIES: ABC transporter ATP-binding protein [unclassified Enterococcus]|uniref:ABC transporter ATP-binding protein n=1 Tax=unclassified Enterococcus TaxID=2608891 RepID=UPI0015538A5D|nr:MULTISPECIES: ABC transporter ATP-binding protein [unclassified Enterococcus]MBS7577330.1 ABC transporter ATP-binding protein [Enterococcus sp. MMGLQ5-2]MBS7584577.1 ABC transporter ATP-binding protein [Enterococcus sp. MMGLQ5-1]NPD12432.1 ABC transporter ATP-binding protein [Enterococcus sp. MMGLQ5-1]NPD37164.1 ABC transporter ATP-binding protein [Enterococcus sp. MMGLQ5-2]
MLETKDLGYWYTQQNDYLFKDINLSFEAGKVYAILGSSGSGKTTFLSLLAGLDQPKSGSILYKGEDIKKIGMTNYRKKDVSIIFQAYNLFSYMTAYENVQTALRISGAKKTDEKDYIIESLKKVGITEDLINKRVTHLSGGQQQRVAIVRAFVSGHELIIADEPTGNLDEITTGEIVDIFKSIAHEQHKTVIIVTHEPEVAKQSDLVYELKNKEFSLKTTEKIVVD